MSIGQKLFDLRKSKQLSQEEVANILNVTRQTVSKWETDASLPEFDKIIPICELYGISADELLSGTKSQENQKEETASNVDIKEDTDFKKEKRAKGIGISVLIYFISVAWIMVTIPVFKMDPIVSSAIFLVIAGIATCLIIYTNMVYKKEKTEKEERESKLQKQICEILSIVVLIIYLFISFITMAWHITWILWVVYGLMEEIIKLIFMFRGNEDEK